MVRSLFMTSPFHLVKLFFSIHLICANIWDVYGRYFELELIGSFYILFSRRKVRWCAPSSNEHFRFCSAASDGKVMRWTCIKGELRPTLLLDLPSATKAIQLTDGTLLNIPGLFSSPNISRYESKKIFRSSNSI